MWKKYFEITDLFNKTVSMIETRIAIHWTEAYVDIQVSELIN